LVIDQNVRVTHHVHEQDMSYLKMKVWFGFGDRQSTLTQVPAGGPGIADRVHEQDMVDLKPKIGFGRHKSECRIAIAGGQVNAAAERARASPGRMPNDTASSPGSLSRS